MVGMKNGRDFQSEIRMDAIYDNAIADPRTSDKDCSPGGKFDLGIKDILPLTGDSNS
jgi:hypothetical protein